MKDAYYFSHDYNARNDPKIMAMRNIYRSEGYGWFWIIIETMAEQKDYKLKHSQWLTNALAMAMLCDAIKVEEFINSCINNFELFNSDGECFWSESLMKRMGIREEKRKKRAEAGKKGAESRWNNGNAIATASQTHSNDIAKDGKGKESKVKDSKVNIIMTPEEEKFISILENIENYPLDIKKDVELYKTLEGKYPTLDLTEVIQGYAIYKLDKPIDKKQNPRSQIRTQCEKNLQWRSCLKKTKSEDPNDRDMTSYYDEEFAKHYGSNYDKEGFI